MSQDENGSVHSCVPQFAAGASAAIASSSATYVQASAAKPVRLGFVGIGGRGSYHLDAALGMEGVEVPALCEIQQDRFERAKGWVEQSGRPTPKLYGRGDRDFERLCAEEELDCVICATPWRWHAPVCLAANRNGKHAVSEVPILLTVDEAWSLVETFEKTGKWSTLGLEQVLLEVGNGMYLTLLNMIRQGVLGDVLHAKTSETKRTWGRTSPSGLSRLPDARTMPSGPKRRWRGQPFADLARTGCIARTSCSRWAGTGDGGQRLGDDLVRRGEAQSLAKAAVEQLLALLVHLGRSLTRGRRPAPQGACTSIDPSRLARTLSGDSLGDSLKEGTVRT